MNSIRYHLYSNIIAALFIFLFAYTAINKLVKLDEFKHVLSNADYIGKNAGFVSWSIILAEWVAVLLLIYVPIRWLGFYLTFLLMTLFTGYILLMLLTSSHLPCSCGGIISQLSWWQHLFLNIFLTIVTVIAIIIEKKKKTRLSIPNRI